MYDYIIVGAGFAGSVVARELAEKDQRVLLVEKRNHIAGNAYDYYNEEGILVHKYGPHIFHTNSDRIFKYLSRFTEWRLYQHRVRASVDGLLVPIPINLDTVNTLYGTNMSSDQLDHWFKQQAESVDRITDAEQAVVSKVGRDLYKKFFEGYTRKQWGREPSELDAQVTARIPTRTNRDDRYFTDRYQAMPLHGYTKMFERMLDHANIDIMLQTDWSHIRDWVTPTKGVVFTGPIDSFFDFSEGILTYRSLKFVHETVDGQLIQPVGTINHPNDYEFTRVTEMKHLTGQSHDKTTLVYEYPMATGDPYYPVPSPETKKVYKKYAQKAAELNSVYFVGRLATYQYYNMDQVVAQALSLTNYLPV